MKKHFCILIMLLSSCHHGYELRYPTERWLTDNDQQPITKPAQREEYLYWDGVDMQFFYPIERWTMVGQNLSHHEALNTNNFDEVANSSWFTNRAGPQVLSGPPAGSWKIISAKTQGKTVGFMIKDSTGQKFLIKLDPPGSVELMTGAEVIGMNFFHAFGYFVPEEYIVHFSAKQLELDSHATTKNEFGEKIPFSAADLQELLKKASDPVNGSWRAVASRFLEGIPLGPTPYRGVRHGDSNDRIPHEHRRELRGYRVFAALLDHNDSREANTLDMFVKNADSEKGYVKHHLIDFGNALGSFGVGPKSQVHNNDYFFNPSRLVATTLAGGFYQPPWEKAQTLQDPAVGFFEAETFVPMHWRPAYPNPAFMNMTERDAFWAAKIIAGIPDAAYPAMVAKAQYTKSSVRDYITTVLLKRKEKIMRRWLDTLNPLDDFVLTPQEFNYAISFTDLAQQQKLYVAGNAEYAMRLTSFKQSPLTAWQKSSVAHFELPPEWLQLMKAGERYRLEITSRRPQNPEKKYPPVDLIVENKAELKLSGLVRHSR